MSSLSMIFPFQLHCKLLNIVHCKLCSRTSQSELLCKIPNLAKQQGSILWQWEFQPFVFLLQFWCFCNFTEDSDSIFYLQIKLKRWQRSWENHLISNWFSCFSMCSCDFWNCHCYSKWIVWYWIYYLQFFSQMMAVDPLKL